LLICRICPMPYAILDRELKQRRRPSGLRRLCLWLKRT
jgi:hypothetical protein